MASTTNTPSRQVRRAAERQAAKVEKASARVTARRAARTAKKMPVLSRDQAKGYPNSRYEPFQPIGKVYTNPGRQEAARRLARMARA